MDKVFSISWSNRILFISFFCIVIFSTIQAQITQLAIPPQILISWAIFVITLSIWASCVALRIMLKANNPLVVEPINKWLQQRVIKYLESNDQLAENIGLKNVENVVKARPEQRTASKEKDYLDSNEILERTNRNPQSPIQNMNLDQIVNDIDLKLVKVWYNNVSNDEAFPIEAKNLLKALMEKFNYQLNHVNHIELARKIGNIFLLHLKEYRRALRRLEKGTILDMEEAYRYVHPGSRTLQALEHSLYRVVTVLAREFLQWELTSSLPCKLLFSILAKKLLSGMEAVSSPEWIFKQLLNAINANTIEDKNPKAERGVVSSALSDAIRSTTAAVISRPLPKSGEAGTNSIESNVDDKSVRNSLEKRASLTLEGLEISHRGLWANVEISEPDSEPEEDRLSPVYEEPTDFATTIARLRSLLHQKSNATTPLQLEEKSCTVYEGSHITIPWTEFHTAPDGSQQLLYCIQFDDIEQHGSHYFETTTATVKRQYSDFAQLHSSLEEVPSLASVLSEINLPEGGRLEMENYLKQLCTRLAADYPPQLRHFLRPNSSSNKKADTVAPRLDRFLAKTVSGVFNTLKTVVPGFEMDPEIDVMPMPTLMSLADVPWRFVENIKSDVARELQQLVAERIDYCSVDTAYEAVDSVEGSGDSELLAHWWETFNTPYDELEELDSGLTLTQMIIDLASEVLVGAGCENVIEQEAVVRTIKLFVGNIVESSIESLILKSFCHLNDLDVFTSSIDEDTIGLDELKDQLIDQLMSTVPPHAKIFLGDNETSEALKFFIKSFQTKKINRDVCLQLLDVFASQLLAASRSNHQLTASH